MIKDKDDLSWYAKKAGEAGRLGAEVRRPSSGKPNVPQGSCGKLLERLARAGIRGSVEDHTLYTKNLPPGCLGCLAGKGTNVYVTGLCTRECFFCFNDRPRTDDIVSHGIRVDQPKAAAEIISRYGIQSVGISGGEPLLFPDRVLGLISALKALPGKMRVDLYTNGDKATQDILRRLREAGLDGLRINVLATGFDISPVTRALAYFDDVSVEIPAVPGDEEKLRGLVLLLDALGAPHLILHELFSNEGNRGGVSLEGHKSGREGTGQHLLWWPTEGSEKTALETLLFAQESAKRLSVYYCSCRTQEKISRNGLRHRARTRS